MRSRLGGKTACSFTGSVTEGPAEEAAGWYKCSECNWKGEGLRATMPGGGMGEGCRRSGSAGMVGRKPYMRRLKDADPAEPEHKRKRREYMRAWTSRKKVRAGHRQPKAALACLRRPSQISCFPCGAHPVVGVCGAAEASG